MRHPCLKGKLSELSHFRAQQTKISYNVVFFNNVYCSEVEGGVNNRFGKKTQV